MKLATPPPLAPGDLVAVVAPAGPFVAGELWPGLAWLRARYRIAIGPGALSRTGYLAGDDARRRDELTRAMLDDEVKAVVGARGGYGCVRIVHDLPWDRFAQRPKWIVGFSDLTTLHALAWRAGVSTVHGPNVLGLGAGVSVAGRAEWLARLERPVARHAWRGLRAVCPGRAVGPVVGGNLATMHALAAAGLLSIPPGALLALEDVGEAPYRVDRMLTSLTRGGHLSEVRGVILGGFDRCPAGAPGRPVEEVLDAWAFSLGVPVVAEAPFGHGARNDAFVLGAIARIEDDAVEWNADPPDEDR